MKKIFYLILAIIILNISMVNAAPAPWGIAINPETKECAGYWPGDEFTSYELPNGWKSYFPGSHQLIKTPKGECVISIYDKSDLFLESLSNCCSNIGTEPVANPSLISTEAYYTNNKYPMDEIFIFKESNYYTCYPNIEYGIALDGNKCYITYQHTQQENNKLYQYFENQEKKNPNIIYFSEDSKIDYNADICNDNTNQNLKAYYIESIDVDYSRIDVDYSRIVTDFGSCNFSIYNNEEECCSSLGLAYVSSNIGEGKTTKIGYQRTLLSPVGLLLLIVSLVILFIIIKYFLKKRRT